MVRYNNDQRLLYMMEEWFYDFSRTKSNRKQQQEFDDRISNNRGSSIKISRNMRKRSSLGEKES
ncbi:hypothetical protein LXJ15735_09480 [Lacrimispora xylanolytica]